MTTTARGMLALLATGVLAISQLSCDVADCDSLSPYETLYVHSSGGNMWVGGTHRLVATGYGVDCEHYIVSDQQPDSFTFVSDNPAVAPITNKGVVTAMTPGKATITVKYKEHTRWIPIVVHEWVSTVAATFSPASPKVGETVAVSFEARTADGQPIKEAKVSSYVLLFRTGRTTSEYVEMLPSATQSQPVFVATAAGTYQTYTSVERVGGPQTTFISKVVVVP